MPKTIMLDDNTYAKLKKKARAEDRSISKMAKILISKAIDSEHVVTVTPNVASPYPPIDWGSESDPEVEHSASKPIRRAETKDTTYDEMMQISQRIRSKAYRDQEMGDEE